MITSLKRNRAGFGTNLILFVAILAGCGKNDIQVYKIAKETSGAQGNQLPDGWKEVPPGEMRIASFSVTGKDGKTADVSVVPLPGMAGGDLGNVNRWRSQLGQPPISEEELAKHAETIDIGGAPAKLYDETGANSTTGGKARILGAIQNRDGVAWFFKMTGDDELVAQQKTAFVKYFKSWSNPESPSKGATSTDLPPSHPPISGIAPTAAAAANGIDEGRPEWQVPAGWKEVSGGQFLVAKFTVTGPENTQAAINVSMSAGNGGGIAGNVNRWRSQLGLGEAPETTLMQDIKSIDLPEGKAMLVDMSGVNARTSQKERLIGAIVPQTGQTWFYKLMGNPNVVEQEKDSFAQFIKSTKYPHAH